MTKVPQKITSRVTSAPRAESNIRVVAGGKDPSEGAEREKPSLANDLSDFPVPAAFSDKFAEERLHQNKVQFDCDVSDQRDNAWRAQDRYEREMVLHELKVKQEVKERALRALQEVQEKALRAEQEVAEKAAKAAQVVASNERSEQQAVKSKERREALEAKQSARSGLAILVGAIIGFLFLMGLAGLVVWHFVTTGQWGALAVVPVLGTILPFLGKFILKYLAKKP